MIDKMIETKLRRENARELLFWHRSAWGWVCIATGLALFAMTRDTDPSGSLALRAWFVIAVFLGFGLVYVCRRDRLRLDLESRRYHRQQGPFWALRTETGTFDQIEGVVLTCNPPELEWFWHLTKGPKAWQLELTFRGVWEGPALIAKLADETSAYAKLEHYARLLGLPALDRTTEGVQRVIDLDPEIDLDLDVPIGVAATAGMPPFDSGIELRGKPGRETIRLPPAVSWGGRLQIERSGNFLRFCTMRRGRRRGAHVLHRREIKEIELRPLLFRDTSGRHQLFIRSDRGIVRIGQRLDPRALEWLRLAVRAMAGRADRQEVEEAPSSAETTPDEPAQDLGFTSMPLPGT